MLSHTSISDWFLVAILLLSSLGILLVKKPVYACLSFLVTLFTLAVIYLKLSAQFIAVMQILVYAGAILVIFMFVIILFQDAYLQIEKIKGKSFWGLLGLAAALLFLAFLLLGGRLNNVTVSNNLVENFGTVQGLGEALYIDFFFPFEAVILLFLISLVGAVYIGRKEI